MAKIKKTFFCQNCGAQSPKWIGKCPACSEWNTYVEEVISKDLAPIWKDEKKASKIGSKPLSIQDIEYADQQRVCTASSEFNRVLGGGIVPGLSLIHI